MSLWARPYRKVGDTSARVYSEKWSTWTLQVSLPAAMLAAELVSATHAVPPTGPQSPAAPDEAPTKCTPSV